MRGGLTASVVLHAAILAWALLTIQSQRELRMPEPEPIAVDLVNASELTKLRKGSRAAKELEATPKESPKDDPAKKEAPKPAPAAAAPPPPPPPPPPQEEPKDEPKKEVAAAVPPPPPPPPPPPEAPPAAAAPPPIPAPDEQKKLDELLKEQERQAAEQKKLEEQKRAEEQRKEEEKRAEEQRKAEEQKRLEEERRQAELKKKQEEEKRRKAAEAKKKRDEEKKRQEAEAKKKQFDAERIAALLNKTPDKGAPASAPLPNEPTKHKGPVLGAPEGRDRQISASEIAILAQIIRSCVQSKWNVLGGSEGAQQVVVKLRLRFNPDGTLTGAPVVMNPQNTPAFLAISDSAIRAAEACQPYSLPPAKYEVWKDIVLNFDPREMF